MLRGKPLLLPGNNSVPAKRTDAGGSIQIQMPARGLYELSR